MEIQSIPVSVHGPNSMPPPPPPLPPHPLTRRDFPPDFIFGAGSSPYQTEGGAKEGGKGPSVWDFWTWGHPDKIADGSNGNVTVDVYHRYKEDVSIMKKMGLDSYRFAISWTRILPSGRLCGGVNKEGVKYYNNLIDELLANDIKPFVTLFHWDLPQALEDAYGGFLSSPIVLDFCDYANICFWEFGDRVKYWNTLNEPMQYTTEGYVDGNWPPGRGSSPSTTTTTTLSLPITTLPEVELEPSFSNNTHILPNGDPGTEPYQVAHHLLLAHAAVIELYRSKYQTCQKGKIGITLNTFWFEPFSEHPNDIKAAERALDFNLGWFLEPMINGHYPQSMRHNVKQRLPYFNHVQSNMLKGSCDFIGINYYTARYAKDAPHAGEGEKPSYTTDIKAKLLSERDKVPIGPQGAPEWLYIYPEGIYKLLVYVKNTYRNPLVYLTENGVGEANDAKLMLSKALIDVPRIDYIDKHLRFLQAAIQMGANVKGYFVWAFSDTFEWSDGFTYRFGLIYVDFKDDLKRYLKESAIWFMNILRKNKKRSLDYYELDDNIVTKK